MNNGYSKIRFVNTTKNSRKSRSVDFSDLYSPPQTLKPFTPISKPPQPTPTTNEEPPPTFKATHDPSPSNEQHGVDGEKFGQILGTHFPNSSKRFKNGEKQTTPFTPSTTTTNISTTTTGGALQSAVKRAFSMRRSCSVSEGYCRIYDQSFDPSTTPINDDEDENMQTRSLKNKKNKRGSRILKACKSLFGF